MLPRFVQKMYKSVQNKSKRKEWMKQGQPVPVPHIIKEELISEYKQKHNLSILVESGTYLGDMVWAQQDNFEKIYTIELSKELYKQSYKRFKKKPHIHLIQGDSGKIMPTLVHEIIDRAIFWLDGHYAGGTTARGDKDCPIWEELKAICSTGIEHVVLIDDARLFIGERDYPTINGVTTYIHELYPKSKIDVKFDCIIAELEK